MDPNQRRNPTASGQAGNCAWVCVALVAWLLTVQQGARCEHALSQVWSEADGLQLQYSTNHDDLLSTKGSELSLSSRKQEEPAAQDQAAAEEAPEAPAAGQQEDEQSADASRQLDKIPASSKQQQVSKQRFNEPAARFKSPSELSDEAGEGRPLKTSPDAQSFSSMLDQAERASADEEEAPAEESNQQRPAGRQGAPTETAEGGAAEPESTNSSERDNESEPAAAAAPADSKSAADEEAPQPTAVGEPDFPGGAESQRQNAKSRNPMIEQEDEAPATAAATAEGPQQNESLDEEPEQAAGRPNDGYRRAALGRQRAPIQPAAQAGRPVAVDEEEGRGEEEPAGPTFYAAAADSHRSSSRPAGAKQPVAPKKLSYFSRVTASQPASPDSVRDNFISPGHFPGSMPHLTQAASEAAQTKQAAKPAEEPKAASGYAAVTAPAPAVPPAVTPQPEASPDGQQIAAPSMVQLQTTTMAPLPSTSSTTSQAPGLKRFKFRKYRLMISKQAARLETIR